MHPQSAGRRGHDAVSPVGGDSDSTNYSHSDLAVIAEECLQKGRCEDVVVYARPAHHASLESIPPARKGDNGPDDTEHVPVHSVFPKRTRIFIIAMAAACGLVSPLSGNIYFPALNALSRDLKVSASLINVSLTTYMIIQGLAPSFMGNFSDTTGRRPAYLIGFTSVFSSMIIVC